MASPWNLPRDKPNHDKNRHSFYNLISRIPAFYHYGVSSEYAKNWVDFVRQKFPDQNLRLHARWMEHRTIPREYYLNQSYKFDLPPKVFVHKDKEKLYINVVAEEADNIVILTDEGDALYDKKYIYSAENILVKVNGFSFFKKVKILTRTKLKINVFSGNNYK